jgi:hypothetical protein
LTETNAIAVCHGGNDYFAKPDSTGYATLVNEVIVVKDGKVQPPGQPGEIWMLVHKLTFLLIIIETTHFAGKVVT